MHFDILTLFPRLFDGFLSESLLCAARTRGIIDVALHNMRDWATDRHATMDDTPYGGGAGMVLKVDRVVSCVEDVQNSCATPARVIMLTPQGRKFTQAVAEELSTEKRIMLLCGRYEGFDDRIRKIIQPDEVSIGDYILNGGEVAAMVIIEAVMRLLPGTLGDATSAQHDTFSPSNISSNQRLLEAPQFTRPREYRGLSVPEILLSGNHAAIAAWRDAESIRVTKERRPDLLDEHSVATRRRVGANNQGTPW